MEVDPNLTRLIDEARGVIADFKPHRGKPSAPVKRESARIRLYELERDMDRISRLLD
ncbi:MAG TPA: hypothetical protein VKB96_00625 [Gammaproteobacteria bacterium]|nr:hypothetical protein [Gammaproteobacteria bacterium]